MKIFNAKTLSFGIFLALSAQHAQADTLVTSLTDVFMSVYDDTTKVSYTADLGTLNNFYAEAVSGQNFSISLGNGFQSWASSALTNGDTLEWNVAGVNTNGTNNSRANAVMFSSFLGGTFFTGTANMGQFLNLITLADDRINDINIGYTQSGDSVFSQPNTVGNYNSSEITNPWGETESGGAGTKAWTEFSNATGTGGVNPIFGYTYNELALQYFTPPATGPLLGGTPVVASILPGYLTLDVANSSLDFVTNSTAVPVPASLWLFLGGLFGVLKSQKRKLGFSV
ncbi:MAG: hypothetical protein ABSB19_01320 [Methylomonas sp.]